MVWSAVLLVLVLVLGRGEAYAFFCDELTASSIAARDIPDDRLSRVHGFFVDPDRQTRVFLRLLPNEKMHNFRQCFLQHEDGPLSPAGNHWTEFAGICRDPVTSRDHAILYSTNSGSGSISRMEYWSVRPDTKQMALEYHQNVVEGELPLVDADGGCVWRQHKTEHDVFNDAIAALRAGTELELGEEALTLEVGATRTLPTRPLSDDDVRHWLHALHTQAPAFATFETARYSDDSHTQSWRILQILGRQLCDAPGVVLLQDTRSGQWRSIYDVPSGCSKVLTFSLLDMLIKGDTLFAYFCTVCVHWGQRANFMLDLPTNRVTRLGEVDSSRGDNIPITDPLAFVDLGGSATPRAADSVR